MPIYEYECTQCHHQMEVLQSISAPELSHCPACETDHLRKRISAAGFRLKGSGWYETDFKTNNKRNVSDTGSETSTGSDQTAKASSAPSSANGKDAASSPSAHGTSSNSASSTSSAAN